MTRDLNIIKVGQLKFLSNPTQPNSWSDSYLKSNWSNPTQPELVWYHFRPTHSSSLTQMTRIPIRLELNTTQKFKKIKLIWTRLNSTWFVWNPNMSHCRTIRNLTNLTYDPTIFWNQINSTQSNLTRHVQLSSIPTYCYYNTKIIKKELWGFIEDFFFFGGGEGQKQTSKRGNL